MAFPWSYGHTKPACPDFLLSSGSGGDAFALWTRQPHKLFWWKGASSRLEFCLPCRLSFADSLQRCLHGWQNLWTFAPFIRKACGPSPKTYWMCDCWIGFGKGFPKRRSGFADGILPAVPFIFCLLHFKTIARLAESANIRSKRRKSLCQSRRMGKDII